MQIEQRVNSESLQEGRDTERVLMAGREWLVEVQVSDTDNPLMWRVETSVFELVEGGDQVGPIDTLVSFAGQY